MTQPLPEMILYILDSPLAHENYPLEFWALALQSKDNIDPGEVALAILDFSSTGGNEKLSIG